MHFGKVSAQQNRCRCCGHYRYIAFALSFEVYARVKSTEPWIKDGIYLGVIIVSAVMLICAGAAFLTAYCVMRKDYAEFNEQ